MICMPWLPSAPVRYHVDKPADFQARIAAMDPHDLRLCRSILFLPASNPRAIEKARTLAADMVVLDLEDAVREEDKAAARDAAVAATQAGFRRPDGGDPGQSGGLGPLWRGRGRGPPLGRRFRDPRQGRKRQAGHGFRPG